MPAGRVGVVDASADQNRRRIVEILSGGPLTAGAIAERFDIRRPAVSQHLAILFEGGVLEVLREPAADFAIGWHVILDTLDRYVGGESWDDVWDGYEALAGHYAVA